VCLWPVRLDHGQDGSYWLVRRISTDLQVKNLAPEEYVASARLRKWCQENKNQYYIPEWLLKAWNMSVNSDLSGAA
jgi:hypothetical protein